MKVRFQNLEYPEMDTPNKDLVRHMVCTRCGDTATCNDVMRRGNIIASSGWDKLFHQACEIPNNVRNVFHIPREFTHSVYGGYPSAFEFVQVCFGSEVASRLTEPHCEDCLREQLAGHTVWAFNHYDTFCTDEKELVGMKLPEGIQLVVRRDQWFSIGVDDSGLKFKDFTNYS